MQQGGQSLIWYSIPTHQKGDTEIGSCSYMVRSNNMVTNREAHNKIINHTCRINVDFPPMLGPVMIWNQLFPLT